LKKKSGGCIQVRQWDGCTVYRKTQTIGGLPRIDWGTIYPNCVEAAKDLQFCKTSVAGGCWVNDGKPHVCQRTGLFWEFRAVVDSFVSDVYCDEKWYGTTFEGIDERVARIWPEHLEISNLGRLRWGRNDQPHFGSKIGRYRTIQIGGIKWGVHELCGLMWFGYRDDPDMTIDHGPVLDSDGCLSNAKTNILGWRTKQEQNANRRKQVGHQARSKPVKLTSVTTGSVLEFASLSAAARSLSTDPSSLRNVCLRFGRFGAYVVEYIKCEDLILPISSVTECGEWINVQLIKETWKPVYISDWLEGGRFYAVRGKPSVRNELSTLAAKPSKKRGYSTVFQEATGT
jgi:hypothetical protein